MKKIKALFVLCLAFAFQGHSQFNENFEAGDLIKTMKTKSIY